MPGVDFSFRPQPDWPHLAATLRRQGGSGPVPLFELGVDDAIMSAVLGRPAPSGSLPQNTEAWCRFRTDFCHKAGYDFVIVGSMFSYHRPVRVEGGGPESSRAGVGPLAVRAAFEQVQWNEVADEHFRHIEMLAGMLPPGMKVRPRCPGGLFAAVLGRMGFEGFSYALADDPKLIEQLCEAIGSRLLRLFARYAEHDAVGGVILCDDMGFKTQTLMPPRVLRQYIFPWHRRIVQAVQAHGKVAILHSDGCLTEVMDDIIACGWDAKHAFEDVIMPVAEVQRRWGNRIGLCGGFDVDRLARSTPEQVRDHVRLLIEQCGPGGGWCLGSGNSVTQYVPVANYVAMQNAGREFGGRT